MTYYRRSHTNNPMSDWGHAMFIDEDGRDSILSYGDYEFEYDGDQAVAIETLHDTIVSAWNKSVEHCTTPIDFEDLDAEDVFAQFNPDDIVMSAGAYDSDLVEWFCEHVGIAHGIKAIATSNGAIVFDKDLVKAI